METPFKGSHRRLKKVLKKSRPNLSISTHSVYQKKLKSAINVSLNSTRMVRSLQANNKSLAASLEKMRQDFRQVHDHYTRLLEENLGLRQKISELQHLNFSEKIEQEVNKKFQERTAFVKKKLSIMSSQATSFLDTFTELTEIFYSAKVPTSEDICHTDLFNYDYSPDASAQCASLDVSMADRSCFDTVESSGTGGIGADASAQKTSQSQEKSIVMQQSFLCSSAESITTTNYEHETVSRRAVSSSSIQTTLSKLPVRIPKPTREPSKWNSDQVKMVMSKLSKNLSEESAQRACRRETFVLTSNEHADEVQCSEIADSDSYDDDVDMHVSQSDDAVTELALPSPAKKEQPKKRSPNMRKSLSAQPESPRKKSSPFMIQPTEIHSPYKSSPEQRLCSPSTSKKARKQSLRMERQSVPKRVSSNQKKNISENIETQKMKSFHLQQKDISHCKKNKKLSSVGKKVFPKHFLKSRDKQKEKLFISNEFDLINAYIQKLGNASSAPNSTMLTNTSQLSQAGEHTIFPEDDMELTMSMEAGITENAIRSLTGSIAHDTNESDEIGCESNFSKTRSRSKQIGETANEMEEDHREEKVPEAVTMRIPKPGQFVFAAARKESDGTRKNVPVVIPKARSKSKKQLSDMIENLPHVEPESIFDFHDKTPVALNTDKQRPTSTEENSSSPKLPGDKRRSRSRNTKKVSKDLRCEPLSEGVKNKEKTIALLGDNVTFEIPLNDSSPASELQCRTRSRSASRKQTESDKSKDETDARFLICRKSTHTGTRPLPKTPCSPRPKHDKQQPANLTSPETHKNQHKVIKGIESEVDDNGSYKSLKYSNSDVTFNQDVSSYVQAETQENIHKGTFIRTRSRTHITDQKKEPSRKAQAEETTNITTPLLAVDLCQEPNQTSEKLQVISYGSDTEYIEGKSARDVAEPRSSSTDCCQDRIQLSSGAVIEETASILGSADDLAANQSAVVSDGAYSAESTDATNVYNTSENAAVDKVPGAELTRKKGRSKLQSKKGKEASLQLLNERLKGDVCTDFVSNRAERTRGKKGDKIMCGEFEAGRKSKSIEDLSADGDYSDKTRPIKLKDIQLDPEVEFSSECSSHLQEKVNHDQLAFLSQIEKKMQGANSAESSVTHRTPKGKKQGPQISKVLKISSPNKPKVHIERPAILNSTESNSLAIVHGKRRAAAKVSYAELPLNAKLRRGDPFTSHYCTTDKIDIFKSPKSKVKKKVPYREVLGSLHNTIQEESLPTERNPQVND